MSFKFDVVHNEKRVRIWRQENEIIIVKQQHTLSLGMRMAKGMVHTHVVKSKGGRTGYGY